MQELLAQIPLAENLRLPAAIGAIIVLTFIAAWIVKTILWVIAHRIAKRTKTDLDDNLLKAARKYIYYLVYLVGLVFLFELLEQTSGEEWSQVFMYADKAIYVLAVFVIARMLAQVFAVGLTWYAENVAAKTESTVDDEFIPLLDRVFKIVVYVLALLISLDHFDVDIKALVAVLGVGSLAIALAAKDTVANMIGGFVIMIDRPFRIGDRVRLDDGTVCKVHSIGIRSTKFWTFDNTLIIVPNAELMSSTVHNITYPHPQVRVRVDIGVGYDSDIDQVRDIMLTAADEHEAVIEDPGPGFYILGFGDNAIDVTIRCYVEDVSQGFKTESEMRQMILEKFREANIEIPFPQRVVTMAETPETEPSEDKAKGTKFMKATRVKRGDPQIDIEDDED